MTIKQAEEIQVGDVVIRKGVRRIIKSALRGPDGNWYFYYINECTPADGPHFGPYGHKELKLPETKKLK